MQFVTRLYQRVAHRRDERGAIMIMAVLGLTVMVISASLSIDIGRIALEKRKDQSVADMAALDAARDRNNALALAQASATRNGFAWNAAGNSLGVEIGSLDSHGAFVPNVGSTSVRATVTSTVKYLFQVGTRTVTAKAVAAMQDFGEVSIGSSLASLNSDQSALLNPIMGQMLTGVASGNANLTLVGWQGLQTSTVTLSAIQQQLVNGGLDVGTLDKLLSTDITLVKFYNANAQALTNQGKLAEANVMSALALTASGSQHFKLGDLFTIDQGASNSALSSSLNVFQLVTGSAEAANGNHLISIPAAAVNVPNVSSTALSFTLIEGKKFYFGRVGGSVSTGQINLTATPALNVPITVVGLVGAKITGSLPVTLTGAGATGTLSSVNCLAPKSIGVGVDTQAVAETAVGALQIAATLPLVGTPVSIPVTMNANQTVAGATNALSFLNPTEFSPPALGKHTGATPGLSSMANSSTITVGSGPVSVPLSTVVNALGPTLASVDSLVLQQLSSALGLEIASADVNALSQQCNVLGLVG